MLNDSNRNKNGRPKGSKNKPGTDSTAFTQKRKDAYCKELEQHGEKPRARLAVSISIDTINRHRAKDANFAAAEREAISMYATRIHAAIAKRGIDGWEEPVFYKDTVVGSKQRYSDACLLAHAKRFSPGEYGDKMKIDQTTKMEGETSLDLEKLSPESRALLRQILEIESRVQKEEG